MAVIVMRGVDAPVPHTVSEFCRAHAGTCHSATESVSELVESYMRQLFLIDAVVLDGSAPRCIENVIVFAIVVLESEDDCVVLCPCKEISGTFI